MDTTGATAKQKTDVVIDKETALKYADQVAAALRGKFVGYTVYVRHIEAAVLNYVEIAVVKKNTDEEHTVAYSEQFFSEMVNAELKQLRARRIFGDLKIHMGIHG